MTMSVNMERVLGAVAALALYALNDVRLFQAMPRAAAPGDGRIHATALQIWGASEQVFLTSFDLALRWGLAGLTVAACLWALAETITPRKSVRP